MKKILFAATLLFTSVCLMAQETPQWIRKSSISPDGKLIAFSYQGDIFTVSADGGKAKQITSNPAYDSDPVWSADGKQIVFSSYREKSKDVWVIPADGGTALRLTDYPGNETPLAVDSKGVVYVSANIQPDAQYGEFPGDPQVYTVDIRGGRLKLFSPVTMSAVSASAGIVLYEDYKGYEDPLRKHHKSSVTRDIWSYNVKKGKFTKLTGFEGEDRNPVISADGKSFFYLSEESGNFNVWRASIADPSMKEQLTSMTTHPVRNLSVSDAGVLCFSYNGNIYTCVPGLSPRKLKLSITKDTSAPDIVKRNISGGISDVAVSPNGKEIAINAHGDIFISSVDSDYTVRLTNTPEQERGVSFSEDGKALYYAAEREGSWGIYKMELSGKDDKYFLTSRNYKETRLTKKGETCFQMAVSPDGKKIAYLKDRTNIVVKDISKGKTNGKEEVILKGVNYSYQDGDQQFEWSPDSQYILCNYGEKGGWNNEDIAVINVDNGEIINLTQSGYSDGAFQWALGGKAMAWQSDKAGFRSHGSWGAERDLYLMFFDAQAYRKFRQNKDARLLDELSAPEESKSKKDKKKEEKDSTAVADKFKPDFDSREDRIVRLTSASGSLGSYYITNNGKSLLYNVATDQGWEFRMMDLEEGDNKVLRKDRVSGLVPDKDGKNLYALSRGSLVKVSTASGKITPVSFSSSYDYNAAAERAYIFEHAWKQVEDKFYDKNIHGVKWQAMHDNYAAFLPYISNNFDFQDMLSEMLGELNGSHTGARYRYRSGLNVGMLGVLFEQENSGKGLKISEVLPGGVLSLEYPELKAGDLITEVEGVAVGDKPWYKVFENTAGKRICITVKSGSKTETLYVVPSASDSELLYKRWVRQREKMVEELSGGRVGYVHVQSMDSKSFREVYSNALGKYRGCEALIVDTRHNGGGWLHDDLATFLSGKAYVEFRPRGQYIGTEPYSKWNKPSCVLVGEDNYSDASGFPYVYKTLGIGKIIGAPVPGTMTAVWWENQIDPSLVFGIPQVTSWGLAEDRPLENLQLEPDILVYNTPESLIEGKDLQIEAAVKEMLETIGPKKETGKK